MCTCTSASLHRANLKKLLVKRVFAPIRIKVKSFSVRRFVLTKTCWCQSQRREVKFDAALSHQLLFIANAISDNLRCAASPRVSTWLFCAAPLLVSPALLWLKQKALAPWRLMYSWFQERLSVPSRRAVVCMCLCAFRMHVWVHLAIRFKPLSLCTGIVGQPQKISSYPTGQGAALRTNLPSISLSDWQPGHLSQDRNL